MTHCHKHPHMETQEFFLRNFLKGLFVGEELFYVITSSFTYAVKSLISTGIDLFCEGVVEI